MCAYKTECVAVQVKKMESTEDVWYCSPLPFCQDGVIVMLDRGTQI